MSRDSEELIQHYSSAKCELGRRLGATREDARNMMCPTGNADLNDMLSGGHYGFTEVVGVAGAGKTQLIISAIAAGFEEQINRAVAESVDFSTLDKRCVIVLNTEGSFPTNRLYSVLKTKICRLTMNRDWNESSVESLINSCLNLVLIERIYSEELGVVGDLNRAATRINSPCRRKANSD